jgi:hypothetical protein
MVNVPPDRTTLLALRISTVTELEYGHWLPSLVGMVSVHVVGAVTGTRLRMYGVGTL